MKQEKVNNNQEVILNISIKKLFYENKILLENFEYKVKKNDKIVIIGNTGCGKTSLLHTFNLLNPNYEGEIYYKNKNIKEYQPNYLRGEIIEVMQEPFLGNNNVKNSIIFPLNFKIHKEKKIDFEKINLYLEKFLLPKNILEKKVEEISGGEKQRIALIRALILKPRVILLDEPSSALDKNTSQIIANFFVKEWNGVVITISHSHIWEEIFPIKFYFENKKIKIK